MYSIRHLNLITSSFCDLKCSYCFLHKNKSFRDFDKFIIEGWKTGLYAKNIKEVFIRLNSDPDEVTDISFWGGEPFLHLDYLVPSFKEIIGYFPNVKSFVVPTNWVHTDIDNLCKLFKIINDEITPREDDQKLHFHLQMSIDGIENDIFMKTGHNASWNQYKNNYDKMLSILDTMYLPNLDIHISISGTGQKDLILKHFSDFDNIKKHILFWEEAKKYVNEKNKKTKNPKVILNNYINFPTIALPVQTSSAEALDIEKMVKLFNQSLYNLNADFKQQEHVFTEYFNCETDWLFYGNNHECPESSQFAITLLPDGTICQCPSGFIENNKEYQKEILDSKDYLLYKETLIASHHFFNPLTATKKDIEDHRWYNILGGFKDTFFTYINLGFSLAQELALSHQIDEIYLLNPKLLYQHLISASTINECFRESVSTTGLPYIGGHDLERRWLNGYIATAYNFHRAAIENTIKLSIQQKISELKEEEEQE